MTSAHPTFPDEFNLADYYLFDRLREGRGGHPAIRFGSRAYTYDDVAMRTRALASYFDRIGVPAEARVYIVLPDTPPFAWVFFAALAHGNVVAMGNPAAPREDLAYVVDYVKATVLVTTQKDLVKIRLSRLGGRPLWCIRVQLRIDEADLLHDLLEDAVARAPEEDVGEEGEFEA